MSNVASLATKAKNHLKTEVHTDLDVFTMLRAEWNHLVKHSVTDTIFLTWEWLSTWWEVYKTDELHVVTCRTQEGDLVGIAPWFVDPNKVLRTIGCEDVTDYLDVIVHRDYQTSVYAALADTVSLHLGKSYERVELCNIPDASPTLSGLVEAVQSVGLSGTVSIQEVCPLIELPDAWDDYLHLLDKKQRHEVRRKLRRVQGADEAIDWYVVSQDMVFGEQMDQFLALMAESDDQKRQFLADERNVAFFHRFSAIALEQGWLQLAFLTVNQEPAAAYLNFVYNGELLVYNSGLSISKYSTLSPGIVLLANIIRDAIEQKLQVFNFLRGDETYKYRMGGKDSYVRKLQIDASPSVSG